MRKDAKREENLAEQYLTHRQEYSKWMQKMIRRAHHQTAEETSKAEAVAILNSK